MIKLSVTDLLAVLRRFDIATDDDRNRMIDQIKRTWPDDESAVVSLRFKKRRYFVIFDHRALDDEDYLRSLIKAEDANAVGEFAQNPFDDRRAFSLPFKGKEAYVFMVNIHRQRLDKELARRYPDISRSTLQKYIKLGNVQVNGQVQTQTRLDVEDTDNISLTMLEMTDFSDQELPIIYLDENVIVVNKPIGVLTHSKGAMNDEFTVADFFKRYTTYQHDSNRPGIVHRLDRDTSGVIIGARNEETATLLQKQFAQRKTIKTYYAVLEGIPKNDKAIIDLPIGRHPQQPSTFRVDAQGKSAVTTYEVIAVTGKYSLVKLMPRSGRTHQLRVHMAYMNTPILGDRVYGKEADRLYLHAASLEITIPVSERRTFSAPLPDEFTNLFPGFQP
jgi:23S rRNA pseudouridine1911/1915/1917 synthase